MSRIDQRALKRVGQGGALLVVLALTLTACGPEPQSALLPASDFAQTLQDLFANIFWWAVGVFVVVEGVLLYALVKFRDRPENEEAAQFHGHTLLEIAWTLAPALILVAIFIPTAQAIFQVDQPPEDAAEALKVEVIGHQWWWRFNYPDLGITTANEMHVPVDRRVELELSSNDVIHSYWVPRLGGKRDVFPGRNTNLWFTPDSTGTYSGACAEYCGTSHALMKTRVVVQDSADFREWVRHQEQPAEAPTDSLASDGRDVFMRVCIACHTVEGTPAQSEIGPDLTHVASRKTIAAGIAENTPENMARWLRHPQQVKPGNKMEIPQLTEDQIEALVAYLETLE